MGALPLFGKKKSAVSQAKSTPVKGEHAKVAPRGFASGYVVKPHITEKATDLGLHTNQFIFVVQKHATKGDIAKDIQKMYGVNVESVHVVRVPEKRMRLGRTQGIKKGYKKAIVKVQKGQTIEIVPT